MWFEVNKEQMEITVCSFLLPKFGVTKMKMRDAQDLHLLNTLRACGYNRSHTAKVLGTGLRYIQRNLARIGIPAGKATDIRSDVENYHGIFEIPVKLAISSIENKYK